MNDTNETTRLGMSYMNSKDEAYILEDQGLGKRSLMNIEQEFEIQMNEMEFSNLNDFHSHLEMSDFSQLINRSSKMVEMKVILKGESPPTFFYDCNIYELPENRVEDFDQLLSQKRKNIFIIANVCDKPYKLGPAVSYVKKYNRNLESSLVVFTKVYIDFKLG